MDPHRADPTMSTLSRSSAGPDSPRPSQTYAEWAKAVDDVLPAGWHAQRMLNLLDRDMRTNIDMCYNAGDTDRSVG